MDDVPAIAKLAERHFRVLEGRASPLAAAEIESSMTMPGRDPRFDFPLVEEDGRVLGSGLVVAQPPYRELGFGWLRDPDQAPDRQRAVLQLLLDAYTLAALQRADDAGGRGEVRQLFGVVRQDDLAAEFLASSGFSPYRQARWCCSARWACASGWSRRRRNCAHWHEACRREDPGGRRTTRLSQTAGSQSLAAAAHCGVTWSFGVLLALPAPERRLYNGRCLF